MKPKFDYRNYDDNTVMHCSSEEAALIFTDYMHSNGLKWCDGDSYLRISNYSRYQERTCYCFINGKYCSFDIYCQRGYKILEFDDFDWDQTDEPEESSEELTIFLNSFS